jgi:hypothetical protein
MVAMVARFGAEDVREIGSNWGSRLFKEAMAAEQHVNPAVRAVTVRA